MSNPALHGEVIKWLQGLELPFFPFSATSRDFSNGYLIAEIFSHYYPQDFSMHSYHKGVSFSSKQQNWRRIQQFFPKHNLNMKKATVDGTLHCKPGAADLLVHDIKYNLTATEIMAEPDMSTNQRKAQIIVRGHLKHRALLPDRSTYVFLYFPNSHSDPVTNQLMFVVKTNLKVYVRTLKGPN
uniref:Spermatogenesis associated 4 n=1 Tax=Fundulus heteroclitus TaxID=8078 RepID=A0A3Q2PEB7_FUNHE